MKHFAERTAKLHWSIEAKKSGEKKRNIKSARGIWNKYARRYLQIKSSLFKDCAQNIARCTAKTYTKTKTVRFKDSICDWIIS